jgi:hypothetical protein
MPTKRRRFLLQNMKKAEYKKELLDYIDKQLDKLTVKQMRVLIASYTKD